MTKTSSKRSLISKITLLIGTVFVFRFINTEKRTRKWADGRLQQMIARILQHKKIADYEDSLKALTHPDVFYTTYERITSKLRNAEVTITKKDQENFLVTMLVTWSDEDTTSATETWQANQVPKSIRQQITNKNDSIQLDWTI